MFADMVNNPAIPCVFERGMWHVPDYQGISLGTGTENREGWRTNRSAALTSPAQLAELQASGQQLIANAVQQQQQLASSWNTPVDQNAPQISSSMAAQPAVPAPMNVFEQQIAAEVGSGGFQ